MTRKNGTLKDFEDKKTKTGERYTRFKIDDEWYSCFNKEASEKLKTYEGKPCSVDIKTVGKFSNIGAVYDDVETTDNAEIEIVTPQNKPTTDRVDRAKAMEFAIASQQTLYDATPSLEALKKTAEEYFKYITEGK